jgi:hypothetical protein
MYSDFSFRPVNKCTAAGRLILNAGRARVVRSVTWVEEKAPLIYESSNAFLKKHINSLVQL